VAPRHRGEQVGELVLVQVARDPELGPAVDDVGAVVAAHDQHGRVDRVEVPPRDGLQAVGVGQAEIEQDEVGLLVERRRLARGAGLCPAQVDDLGTGGVEQGPHDGDVAGIVLHEQDAHGPPLGHGQVLLGHRAARAQR
jgi:hypothetical protein